MKAQLLFDITSCEGTLKSLGKMLNIDQRQIVRYIATRKNEYSVDDFLEVFDISDEQLSDKDILLTSLHVTTNNDNCASIKEYGLINLQKAITLDTPLNRYLKEQGVKIDVLGKKIHHGSKVYDISKEYNGIDSGSYDEELNWVIRKLYVDYQINSFFYADNILEYGGDVSRGPEFLINLNRFLKSSDIEDNWKTSSENKCYVIKFFAPITKFTDYTFNVEDMDYLDGDELYLEKVKSVIDKSLSHIHDDIFYRHVNECYSYLKFDESIPYTDILKIYTDVEYLEEYTIREE